MTVRSEMTSTESKTLWSFASWSSARKCADHAMEFVFPEPAECCTRYFAPGPSRSTAAWSFRVTSSW